MTKDDAAHAGDPPPMGDAAGGRGISSLDQLADWSVGTQDFVRTLGTAYRRWSKTPPNSPQQRQAFERKLWALIADATALETRLRDIGATLPERPDGPDRDDGDQAAGVVYRQLTTAGFTVAWRQMVRQLERQVVDIQEPKTEEEWREYFRRFDAVWRGAQELGSAARAAGNLLDELGLGPGSRPRDDDLPAPSSPRELFEVVGTTCGELVRFLVDHEILREDGLPPPSSQKIVELYPKHGGGGGARRLDALTPKLERYLGLVDDLIEALKEFFFVRMGRDGNEDAARLRHELLQLSACAKYRYEIASRVLHAALQMADPIFVAPREALHHAMDAMSVLQDLALRDQRFGRVVKTAEGIPRGPQLPPPSWGELDQVEQAIISHLRQRGLATRAEMEGDMRNFSPSTVWRRLQRLRKARLVETLPGSPAKPPRRKPAQGVSALLRGKKSSSPGGSAPRVFRLTALAEGLQPGDDGT